MKRNLFYAIIIIATMVACNNNDFLAESNMPNNPVEELSAVEKAYLADPEASVLREFGKALYSAMSESPMLREIIKTEAMKQFDKDYDVLYQLIKNREVENGLTVSKLLQKHFDDAATLMRIEARCPLLTIFVPVLPEDSFSAETWNTAEQVPAVAIHTKHYNIPVISEYGFFDENSNEFVVAAGYIPAFPVVTLKQNARVRLVQNTVQSQSAVFNNSGSDFVFEFVDDFFDNSKTENVLLILFPSELVDQKLQDAYTIYENTDGWQRDYIYYGITPSDTTGTIDRRFIETITSFRFSTSGINTPAKVLNDLTNHSGDPTLLPIVANTTVLPWSNENNYSFLINVEVPTTNTSPVKAQRFTASPEELFVVTYTKKKILFVEFYETTLTGFKTVTPNTTLMTWSLADFAPEMSITIEKENPNQQIITETSISSEFAGNVGIDLTFGTETKTGLKFGASVKDTKTSSYKTTTTLTNKYLGAVRVHFEHTVVTSTINSTGGIIIPIIYNIREYNNGMFVVTVEPKLQ